ncbi:g9154 [Coccomyxa viridis]|uniref:G9154 protein n=1 Tax=Coccomyxa viridis TaxID=1274662 RepID=A0ABP1G294_9CHLO
MEYCVGPAPSSRRTPGRGAFLEGRPSREDSRDFEADGRVLRLKQYVPSDLLPGHMDAILDALAANTRVEVLYIQNFEWGMLDAQLRHLGEVLGNKRIWALNVGENFQITNQAWERFTLALEDTAVAYLYVSEQHLRNTDLKVRMRDAVRLHRRAGPARDPEVVDKVGNMWWNPKTSKKRRLTSTEFDRMMAAMKRRCVRHLVLQTQFDDLAKEHETALRLARDLSRECTAAQIEAAESREAEEAARERLRSYIERLQKIDA